MRSIQYLALGGGPQIVEVETPRPGPGEVLVKVLAAGLCHTDLHLMSLPESHFRFPLPFALGHESAGVVATVGAGVDPAIVGDAVAVYGAWGCGRCRICATGAENMCPHREFFDGRRPGLGGPGGLSEYMLVDDVRHLVPLGDLTPVAAAGLTDAGLSAFHAVRAESSRLAPGSTTIVIGVGGLGHAAIQILRATTSTVVVAIDVAEAKRELAIELGAHVVLAAGSDARDEILRLTGGVGADVVLDFVGSAATLELAGRAVRIGGGIQAVGAGGAGLEVGQQLVPPGVQVSVPFWGALRDLHDVVALARAGRLAIRTTPFALDAAPEAYLCLAEGTVPGRAVIVMDSY